MMQDRERRGHGVIASGKLCTGLKTRRLQHVFQNSTSNSPLILVFVCLYTSAQIFPYSLLAMAMLMYLPVLIWRQLVMPTLGSDLLFIIDELDKSYNRSIRLAQSILDMRQNTKNPLTFQAELQR